MIKTIFPTTIMVEENIIPKYLNEEIKDYILLKEQMESEDKNKAWHSKYENLDHAPKCISLLKEKVVQYFEEYYADWTKEEFEMSDMNAKVEDPTQHITTKEYLAWYLIQKKYDYIVPHVHPQATFSCTYYCQVPEFEEDSFQGSIEFLNPVGGMTMSLPYKNKEKFIIKPKEGMFILFPSYLSHWVHPINEECNRITVGFDIKVNIER